jgi:hypothetical protein
VIYTESNYPRNIIFDFSENIRPYYLQNEKISTKNQKIIEQQAKKENKR